MSERSAAAWCQAVASRDGLTPDQVYVLVMQWAWPWGIAIKPAIEKAIEGHPHWHAWRMEQDAAALPSAAEWDATIARELARAD